MTTNTMRPMRVRFGVFTSVLLLWLGVAAAPAHADTTTQCPGAKCGCGAMGAVSGHVVFTADMVCTDTSGLTVVADNTTIDLHGFRLQCQGTGFRFSCQ